MRRAAVAAIVLASMTVLGAGVASAESQTVLGSAPGPGRGDITKLVANNGAKAVTAQVFGLGKPCGGAQTLTVNVENRAGKVLYFAQGGCYGATWATDLYYTSTGQQEDAKAVRCRTFEFSRVRASGAYRIVVPRSCLDQAPNSVRLEADGNNYGSVTGGHAGPTKLLKRG
jgi:hypothetical protein